MQMVIKKLMKNIIETSTLNGKFRGENVLLPRTPMILTYVPIKFMCVQFPSRLAFAMTINKLQDQMMSVCSLDLGTSCLFTQKIILDMFLRRQTIELICVG